jgi:murein L,D-transpeptidase YafK
MARVCGDLTDGTAVARRAAMPTFIPLLVLALVCSSSSPSPSPVRSSSARDCRASETGIVVDTRAHQLHLCADGKIERTFAVALGMSGVGKQRQGDNRTPLGRYALGPPRASQHFHIFVPVQYPTPAQARLGFTGGAIGIHGPPRGWSFAELGALVAQDWTAGCIAVATDNDIEAIAAWIHQHGVKDVRLEV